MVRKQLEMMMATVWSSARNNDVNVNDTSQCFLSEAMLSSEVHSACDMLKGPDPKRQRQDYVWTKQCKDHANDYVMKHVGNKAKK